MAENSAPKQRRRGPGRPFKKGESGNRAGKRKGTRHQITVLAEQLPSDDVEAVVAKVLNRHAGSMPAAKLILDRIAPPRRGSPVAFPLPEVNTSAGIANALAAIVSAMAAGVLTPDEATAEISPLLSRHSGARLRPSYLRPEWPLLRSS